MIMDVASSWWSALEGVAVGGGDDEGGVGEEFGVPAGGVEQVVVPRAFEDKVFEAGGSAAGDPLDVMRLAPFGWSVTAGEPAVLVPDDQGVVQVGGDGAGGGAVVEDAGASGDEHPMDSGVTEQALHGGAVQDGAVDQPALAATLEIIEGGNHIEVGAVAAAAAVLLMVQEPAARVGAAAGGAALGLTVQVFGGGEADGGLDERAGFGVEAAPQLAAPVQDPRHMQRPLRLTLVRRIVEDRFGVAGPGLHPGRGLGHRQLRKPGDELGLVLGEQAGGAVAQVGDDGLHLPPRQGPGAVGGGHDGQLAEPAGGLGAQGGVAAGALGPAPQPGGHGGGAVVAPHLGPIVLTDGGNEFGVEPVCEPERLGQYIVVDGQVETIDGVSQRLNDGDDLGGHTASVLVFE